MNIQKYINSKKLIGYLFPKKEYTKYFFEESIKNGNDKFDELEELALNHLGNNELTIKEKDSTEGIHYNNGIFLENIIEQNNENIILKTKIECEKGKDNSELIKEFKNFYNTIKDKHPHKNSI